MLLYKATVPAVLISEVSLHAHDKSMLFALPAKEGMANLSQVVGTIACAAWLIYMLTLQRLACRYDFLWLPVILIACLPPVCSRCYRHAGHAADQDKLLSAPAVVVEAAQSSGPMLVCPALPRDPRLCTAWAALVSINQAQNPSCKVPSTVVTNSSRSISQALEPLQAVSTKVLPGALPAISQALGPLSAITVTPPPPSNKDQSVQQYKQVLCSQPSQSQLELHQLPQTTSEVATKLTVLVAEPLLSITPKSGSVALTSVSLITSGHTLSDSIQQDRSRDRLVPSNPSAPCVVQPTRSENPVDITVVQSQFFVTASAAAAGEYSCQMECLQGGFCKSGSYSCDIQTWPEHQTQQPAGFLKYAQYEPQGSGASEFEPAPKHAQHALIGEMLPGLKEVWVPPVHPQPEAWSPAAGQALHSDSCFARCALPPTFEMPSDVCISWDLKQQALQAAWQQQQQQQQKQYVQEQQQQWFHHQQRQSQCQPHYQLQWQQQHHQSMPLVPSGTANGYNSPWQPFSSTTASGTGLDGSNQDASWWMLPQCAADGMFPFDSSPSTSQCEAQHIMLSVWRYYCFHAELAFVTRPWRTWPWPLSAKLAQCCIKQSDTCYI